MAELYGVDDELPTDLRDHALDTDPPVGPANDGDTATVDTDPDGDPK